MHRVVSTGCSALDERLGGGLKERRIILVYGEAETGKTTLAIQCAVNCARTGYKTIFVDCDGTFLPQRISQIAGGNLKAVASQIVLVKPEDFKQQAFAVDGLSEIVSEKVGLVAVDTITNLYRKELGGNMKRRLALNRELNRQLASLAQTTKTRKVATLLTSQVRSVILEKHESTQPVAPRVLEFWADTAISLTPTSKPSILKAKVETSSDGKPSESTFLRIGEKGLSDCKR